MFLKSITFMQCFQNTIYILCILCFYGLSFDDLYGQHTRKFENNIVRINVIKREYSFLRPWQQPRTSQNSGSGFIIGKNLIITNAHVVHNALLVRIQLATDTREYPVRIKIIANDCDLALLETADREFDDSQILSLAPSKKLPELQSSVSVYGYPIGGDSISVTQGIVSRVDFDTYSFSGIDQHLVIQVDAAINPGNSGGPAIQNGKVIGIAFQGRRSGEGLGYLIPANIIQHFLQDVSDGKYEGFPELGILYQKTESKNIRRALHLDKILSNDSGNSGVYVNNILPSSSSEGFIKKGDVVLAINGFPISASGEIKNTEGRIYPLEQIVEDLYEGDKIRLKVLRNKKLIQVLFKARSLNKQFEFKRKNNIKKPPFVLYANLLFQPISADLLGELLNSDYSKNLTITHYRYIYFLIAELYKDVEQDVLLTYIFPDSSYKTNALYQYDTVVKVNEERVQNLSHFIELMDRAMLASDSTVQLYFLNNKTPLIIDTLNANKITKRISSQYGIQKTRE